MLDSNTHSNKAAMPYVQSCSTPRIANTGMTCWVEQLTELLVQDTVREDWYVIGSAAILEHNVKRQALDIAQGVAKRLGVPLTEWTNRPSTGMPIVT